MNTQRDEFFLATNKVSKIEEGKVFFYIGIPSYNQWNAFTGVDIEISSAGEEKVFFKKQNIGSILKYHDYEFRFMDYENYYLKIKVTRFNNKNQRMQLPDRKKCSDPLHLEVPCRNV